MRSWHDTVQMEQSEYLMRNNLLVQLKLGVRAKRET